MIFNENKMLFFFRISSALVIAGLLLEIISLLWFSPLSFVLFAFVASAIIGLGILIYLASLVYAMLPTSDNRG